MNKLRGMVTGFLLLKLGVLAVNLRQFPVLGRGPAADPRADSVAAGCQPLVSLLVPMRNEAARLAASVPGLLAQHADEIILLDDESTDGTGSLARSLLAGDVRARWRTAYRRRPGGSAKAGPAISWRPGLPDRC